MTLVNLLRDQWHVAPGQTPIDFSSTSTLGSTLKMNSTGIVNQTIGNVFNPRTVPGSVSSTVWKAVGVLMSQPIVDSTPYRVKIRVAADETPVYAFIGYADSVITGTDDAVAKVVPIPLQGRSFEERHFDDIILLPALLPTDPLVNSPVAVGLVVTNSAVTSSICFNISVQNLSKTAPQFAASMS